METIKCLLKFAFCPQKANKEMLETVYARNIVLIEAVATTLITMIVFCVEKHRSPGIVAFLAGTIFLLVYILSFLSGAILYFLDKIFAKKIFTFRKCYKMSLITIAIPLISSIFKTLLMLLGFELTGWIEIIFKLCINIYEVGILLYYLNKFYAYNKRDVLILACVHAILILYPILK